MIFALKAAVATSLVVPIAVAAPSPSRTADTKAVETVLSEYKAAIEKLDATGTERLFAADSQIFETGGSEGTYATYLAIILGRSWRRSNRSNSSTTRSAFASKVRSHSRPKAIASGSSRRPGPLPNGLASLPAS